MSQRQTLDTTRTNPPLPQAIAAHTAVAAACLLAHLSPKRLQTVLRAARRGARPATYTQALTARQHVTAASTLCSGNYCLQRSLATVLLCRLRGTWPTWCTGVRTTPFAAHAWVEAEGHPVGEPDDTATYRTMITITPP